MDSVSSSQVQCNLVSHSSTSCAASIGCRDCSELWQWRWVRASTRPSSDSTASDWPVVSRSIQQLSRCSCRTGTHRRSNPWSSRTVSPTTPWQTKGAQMILLYVDESQRSVRSAVEERFSLGFADAESWEELGVSFHGSSTSSSPTVPWLT